MLSHLEELKLLVETRSRPCQSSERILFHLVTMENRKMWLHPFLLASDEANYPPHVLYVDGG